MLSHVFFKNLSVGIAFLNSKKEIIDSNETFTTIVKSFEENLFKIVESNRFLFDEENPIPEEIKSLGTLDKQDGSLLNVHASSLSINGKHTGILFLDTKQTDIKFTDRTLELYKSILLQITTKAKFKEQKRASELLSFQATENQLLFTSIAKHYPNGMIVVIDKNYKIVFVEGRDFEKLNLDAKSFKDAIFDDIELSVDRIARGKNYIKQTLEGAELTQEVFFKGQVYALNSMPLYNEHKQISQALFVYANITKQKKVEQNMLMALEKEKELNELKSRFVSMASHEFRTPLSVIISATNLLQRQNEKGLEEKFKKNIHRIKSNVKILENILNDFLSVTKIEEGITQPEYVHFDALTTVKKAIEDAEIYKKERQLINLNVENSDFTVHLDEQFLTLIVSNLLSNAVKYSSEGKTIDVNLKIEKSLLVISIKDEGIGISEQDQHYLFTRFFRAKNAINIKGNGLGLYILKQYVHLMNGIINVKSTLQEGSEFTVKLPCNL